MKDFFLYLLLEEFEDIGISLIDGGILFDIFFELIRNYLKMVFFEYVILILILLFLKLVFFMIFVVREFGKGEGLMGFFNWCLCGGI